MALLLPPSRKSTIAPFAKVWPCAACAVMANAGMRGSWVRVNLSMGCKRPLSKNQSLFFGTMGYSPRSFRPGSVHGSSSSFVPLNFTYTTKGKLCKIRFPFWNVLFSSGCKTQECTYPTRPLKIRFSKLRSTWSVIATGMPFMSGRIPYKSPLSRSCLLKNSSLRADKSGLSLNAWWLGWSSAIQYMMPSFSDAA